MASASNKKPRIAFKSLFKCEIEETVQHISGGWFLFLCSDICFLCSTFVYLSCYILHVHMYVRVCLCVHVQLDDMWVRARQRRNVCGKNTRCILFMTLTRNNNTHHNEHIWKQHLNTKASPPSSPKNGVRRTTIVIRAEESECCNVARYRCIHWSSQSSSIA